MAETAGHWENVYGTKAVDDVSWFEAEPGLSLRFVGSVSDTGGSVIDVGAGASVLVDRLVARGYRDVTVLDVSNAALDNVRRRFEGSAHAPSFVVADVSAWEPSRKYDVWHDRAVFHFMVTSEMRAGYARAMAAAVAPGGHAIVATFAPDGPEQCSGITVDHYSAESLAARFAADFESVASETHVHTPPWGAEQPFTWVVLRRR